MDAEAATRMEMRGEGLRSAAGDHPTFAGRIELPYKLTTGRAAATFLAELAERRIVGTRCPSCEEVSVPAQDFCAACGEVLEDLVEVGSGGELRGFTETANGVIGLVRLDGATTEFPHRILETGIGDLSIGQRVEVSWAEEAEGRILDIAGFVPGGEAAAAEPKPLAEPLAEPVLETPYRLRLDYEHAYGAYYGTLFDGLATSRRIQGSRCPSCTKVLVPPREYCDVCFVRTGEWVDVADTGVIKAFSIIHLEFVGQVREPPYVYAEIVLDGASTRLIHTVGGIEVDEAMERLVPGKTRVRAVWKDGEPVGSLEDILHFEPIFDE